MPNASPGQFTIALAEKLGYVDFVKQRGVPDAKVKACLSDPKALDDIAKQADAATRQYNVGGTPTFIVNGTVATNVADWAGLQPALKAAGAL